MNCKAVARFVPLLAGLALAAWLVPTSRGKEPQIPAGGQKSESAQKIEFIQETLDNGLRVIYAPLHNAPVVHVRVLYHVGSRDERADRQGFAHMFEHMMFRGSAHVAPEEHMKLIGSVGGNSNAFTSFDQTVYVNTIPSNHLEMALYLEADRMASFKVSEQIYKTERKVVAEEWRIRQNRPYGTLYEDFFKNVFTTHSYRWTPIGNMDHLRAAAVNELQEFFNTYYLPNNAVLVVAGDIDVNATRAMVTKYYGWVPRGPEVPRQIPVEPPQTQRREATVHYRVPLPAVNIGWHTPPFESDDHYALDLLASVMGGGRSSRLDRLLVNNENPLAVEASASNMQLEDAGMFMVSSTVMQGKDPKQVEKVLADAVADVLAKGVTEEELNKAKTLARVGLTRGRETATSLASQLGEQALFAGDPNRVNTAMARLEAVTPADVLAVAKKYLDPNRSTLLRVAPDPLGKEARPAATQAAEVANAPVAPATRPVKPREVTFPGYFPEKPPMAEARANPEFEKGTESTIDGVKVIVMPDPRLPLVNWSLTMRSGSHRDPRGKEGLASITGDMLRRGAAGMTFDQLNQDLESRGITLEVRDGGDITRLAGSCITNELDHGLKRTKQVLYDPTFPEDEFRKLKEQMLSSLQLSQVNPSNVAGEELDEAVFGESALGVHPTPRSVSAITLDDVKDFYAGQFRKDGALLVFSGDVTVERGQALARELLKDWPAANSSGTPQNVVSYRYPPVPEKRKIIVVDNPAGKGAVVEMGILAYDIRSDDKFAGSVASQILTAGIDSRLNRYVRAEKGLSYGVHGVFRPNRHGGAFTAGTSTGIDTVGETAAAMFKVFDDMRKSPVTPEELRQAQTRVAGGMVMQMQTIGQQAQNRVEGILNGYPIDYYDTYPQKIAAVTAEQVRDVMNKYVNDNRMAIIVVAPAAQVKAQLEKLGDVRVIPMPAERDAGAKPTTRELLKKAA
jgi:zinc protease